MKLAKYLNLSVPEVDLLNIAGKDVFVVERYDRYKNEKEIQRLHQEDFCQALGIMSTSKYQNDGGPGIADIYSVIKKICSIPAIETRKFLKYVVFNYIIGNCDSHGKNYSLLYKNNTVELAPIYDAVSTAIYPELTDKLSMKIGSHYELKKVLKEDFWSLCEVLDIKKNVVESIFRDFQNTLDKAYEGLRKDEKINLSVADRIFDGIQERMWE